MGIDHNSANNGIEDSPEVMSFVFIERSPKNVGREDGFASQQTVGASFESIGKENRGEKDQDTR
ncbi:MAG: hypothetical protein UX38_C0004G0008 [Microgenomates group bacterium GW2011_GWC1_46_16]|nr:MAG: hypothetical protein UX32_C0009G0006 [Microgenomates group bacterium GW2011_GWF1_46_12]KKU26628.1 MAG: hypothetical protein UX38_C0004G0008 [Microgenomates group bacterium GW2011_GWC1_46_16]KKU45462.1 MAG: hypothetical protein UX63_C0005G0014 [Microgenomates group bacterium GW2011_GWB1_46_7]